MPAPKMLLILAMSLAVPAVAKDFRTMNFADDCMGIAALESLEGATGPNQDGAVMQLFHGTFEGHPADILYICRDGRFAEGRYILQQQWSFPETRALAGQLKTVLTDKYGLPTYQDVDGNNLKAAGITPSAVDKLAAFWEVGRVRIHLGVVGQTPEGYWQIYVSYYDRRRTP